MSDVNGVHEIVIKSPMSDKKAILTIHADSVTNPLTLEQLEEALRDSIVMAVVSPAHAADQVVVAQEGLPVMPGELTPLIGMHQHRLLWLSASQRHQQGVEHQLGVDAAAHGPANDLAREQIEHHRQVQPAFVGADVVMSVTHNWLGRSGLNCRSRWLGATTAGLPPCPPVRRR